LCTPFSGCEHKQNLSDEGMVHYMVDRKEERKRTYRALAIVLCIITLPIAILYYGYFQFAYAEKLFLTQNSPNKKIRLKLGFVDRMLFFECTDSNILR